MSQPADRLAPRSLLFMPGSNVRALEKAASLSTDAIVFDLEDAVAPADKSAARTNVRKFLGQHQKSAKYSDRDLIVRINAADTPWCEEDLAALSGFNISAVLLPKVEQASDLKALRDLPDSVKVWAMIETPLGVLNAATLASLRNVSALVLGSNDLSAGLQARLSAGRPEIMVAAQHLLLAARAHQCWAFDSVYNAFRDDAGFLEDANLGHALGFDGKSLIHPNQIELCHQVYAPSVEDVQAAQAVISAYQAGGAGVATLDGKMIEELHVRAAERVLRNAAR